MSLFIDIAMVLVFIAIFILCIAATVVLFRLAPPLLRSVRSLDKITQDAASVSEDVTRDTFRTTRNLAIASDRLSEGSANLAKVADDIASVSESVAQDLAKTAHNAATASEHAAQVTADLERISNDVSAVSGDFARDASRVAQNSAAASENAVEASRNVVNAAADFAEAAANVAAYSRLDVRAVLAQVAAGNINNLKDLAGFVGQNLSRAASRVGSMFRRGVD